MHDLEERLSERYKTCGRCVYDSEGKFGLHCYVCKRNPVDNRLDNFKEVKKDERN